MAISFVGSATWTGTTNNDDFTLTKPADIGEEDLLIAVLVVNVSGAQRTVTPPTGWTLVRTVAAVAGGSQEDTQISVMKRTAGSSEPATWAGTISASETPKGSIVVAYRGADPAANQFVAEAGSTNTVNGGSSITTATVNNTDANAWRITVAAQFEDGIGPDWTSNEVTERADFTIGNFGSMMYSDSNGVIATGNTSRTCDYGAAWWTAASWIGILKPFSNVSGTLGMTAPGPSVSFNATAKTSGPLSLTAPSLAGDLDGDVFNVGTADLSAPSAQVSINASVKEGLGISAPRASMSLAGALKVSGTVGLTAPIPTMVAGGEARISGNRVITVKTESRVVIP